MVDPTPGESLHSESLTIAERDARIEQLLVSGLDEYFAGRMDQAVNVWTRVLFLDRTNDRARAYIDRARRAQAERQRESEGLVHEGLQAFDHGEVDRARQLLTAAIERGAPHEQALPVLHRIGLLDRPLVGSGDDLVARARVVPPRKGGGARAMGAWALATVVAVASAAALYLAGAAPAPGRVAASPEVLAAPLPVPAAADAHLLRARRLFEAGKLPDALATLEQIPLGDSAYADAQALRIRIQRELLRSADVAGERARP
ncbi:MAG: hypothetical protein R2745_04735 [Vicinamibacterales bacterium]